MKNIFSRFLRRPEKASAAELAASLVELTVVLALVVVVCLTAARLMWGAMKDNMRVTVATNAKALLATIEVQPKVAEILPSGAVRFIDDATFVDQQLTHFSRAVRSNTEHLGNEFLGVATAAARVVRVTASGDVYSPDGRPVPISHSTQDSSAQPVLITSCDIQFSLCISIDQDGNKANCSAAIITELTNFLLGRYSPPNCAGSGVEQFRLPGGFFHSEIRDPVFREYDAAGGGQDLVPEAKTHNLPSTGGTT